MKDENWKKVAENVTSGFEKKKKFYKDATDSQMLKWRRVVLEFLGLYRWVTMGRQWVDGVLF